MSDRCLLCLKPGPLLESHIIPAFTFKALKRGSATGHIRNTENPNVRVQDGLTEPWLCADCEARFSRWEREFANQIFHPWSAGATRSSYEDWMLKFCVSVSWRVLKYCKGRNPDARYSDLQEQMINDANNVWREFLLDNRPHPGKFTQQFVFFDLIESTSIRDLPENINRFMINAIAMDIVGSSNSLMTWAKLGQFQIFGVVQEGSEKFEGTKVHVRHGVLTPGKVVLPGGLLSLFREKASHAREAMASISEPQANKIDAAVLGNLDRVAASKQFAAMEADAAMFGDQAILRQPRKI